MKKVLTVKYAILLRCRDCVEGRISNCTFKKCPLFEKAKAGATGRSKAVKEYCRWCRNGLSMISCASTTCGIYLYFNKIPVSEKRLHPNKRILTPEAKKKISDRFALLRSQKDIRGK